MNFDFLNNKQIEVVKQTDGPVLVLAGAGSGKTTTLVYRILYLINEKGVNPYNILAVTFTNKASNEMCERIEKKLLKDNNVFVSTFHKLCVYILRIYIHLIGYTKFFSIYDREDQISLIKKICEQKDYSKTKRFYKLIVSKISKLKNKMILPDDCDDEEDFIEIYREYQVQMKTMNALDFDDLLLKTIELFDSNKNILEIWQERFKYIMVDEYQDINKIQFNLIYKLASKYKNLCVVGDDDQSIYKFRGAEVENIMNFDSIFKNTKIIKLEQNYRSTKNILEVANNIIKNNKLRRSKRLWTNNQQGVKVNNFQFENEFEEAEFVVNDIYKKYKQGENLNSFVILYRANSLSRIFEEKLIYKGIKYKIIGGINFYSRKEIKDLISYLKVIFNGDELSIRRIINLPKRGIGTSTISKILNLSIDKNIDFFNAIKFIIDDTNYSSNIRTKLKKFYDFILNLREFSNNNSLLELFDKLLNTSEYLNMLKDTVDDSIKFSNIYELLDIIKSYEDSNEIQLRIENIIELRNKISLFNGSLSDFLEEISLITDLESFNNEKDYICLMTLHLSKGLEFNNVYMVCMEDGVLPYSIKDFVIDDMEEERRLCYVGITRAKNTLTFTSSLVRFLHGEYRYNNISRFILEIPDELLNSKYNLKDISYNF